MVVGVGLFILGGTIGAAITYALMGDIYRFEIELASEQVKRAFRECGKLSKRIHKQRLMIKTLKANQVPKPKKQYTPVELSH